MAVACVISLWLVVILALVLLGKRPAPGSRGVTVRASLYLVRCRTGLCGGAAWLCRNPDKTLFGLAEAVVPAASRDQIGLKAFTEFLSTAGPLGHVAGR